MKRIIILTITLILLLIIIVLADNHKTKSDKHIEYQVPPYIPKVVKDKEEILFLGDIMLDRGVSSRMNTFGLDYPFKNIKNLLLESELVVANLEGVFTDNESVTKNNSGILRFTFDKKIIPILKDFNFKIFSQANNHTNDFGLDGANDSRSTLNSNGMYIFGDFFNQNDEKVTVRVNDIDIILIGYNEFSYKNKDKVLELIRSSKSDQNRVVLMPHWGIEYETLSNYNQQLIAKEFIDNGADIVIGAHPHVVQEIEIYKNKPIFYSLGNFVFDQDFSKETTEGLGVRIVFEDGSTSIELIPFDIIKSQVILKDIENKNVFLENLSNRSQVEIRDQIKEGKISITNI